MSHPTDWMHDAKWGVFLHFLSGAASETKPDGVTADDWNRRVAEFDVEGLASQLESIGAGWLGLTVGQNSGFYCSPNAAYDRIVGREPSRLSRRDLMADAAVALTRRGIRLMAYLPTGAPENDALACEKLRWIKKRDERLPEFQEMWQEIIIEWSRRWGDKVSAWWMDGAYFADAMYRSPDAPNFASFRAALKAGNPEALVAFNPNIQVEQIVGMAGSGEDFMAGEINATLPVPFRQKHKAAQWTRFNDEGAQFHVLGYLGAFWGQGEPRFPDELARGYTQLVNDAGGAVTWDVPVGPRGLIPTEFLEQLSGLR